MLLTKIDHFFKNKNVGRPVLSLIEIYLKWCKWSKKAQLIKTKKKIDLFVETCMKYFRGLYDLKVNFLDKSFEKYNAVRTQFDNFLLNGRYGSNRIVHD